MTEISRPEFDESAIPDEDKDYSDENADFDADEANDEGDFNGNGK